MIERVTDDGRWTSEDSGMSWQLVEPSVEWLTARAAQAINPQIGLWQNEAPPVIEEEQPSQ